MATVIFSWQLLGGEIHNFGNRELLKTSSDHWPFIIQNMLVAIVAVYVVAGPLLAAIFLFDLLPARLALWFFPILMFEHLSQEMHRTLNATGNQLKAGMVLFLRSGSWVWLALATILWAPETRHLQTIFAWWLIGGILSAFVGGLMIYQLAPAWRWLKIDKNWLRNAYRVGLLFLVSSLSFRALTVADRYAMSFINGDDLLGVYVFYAGLSMSVILVLEPAVVAFLQPKLVAAFFQKKRDEYRRTFRELCWSSIGLSLALTIAVAFISPWIIDWTNRPIYGDYLTLFWVLLCAPILYALGLPIHCALYARGMDRHLMLANLSSLLAFVFSTMLLSDNFPIYAPALGLNAALLWAACLRTWFYLKR